MATVSFAQQSAEEEFVPEGARGRWTVEQAQRFALEAVSGEIIDTDIWRDDNRVYYDYTIRKPDESVFDVDVNAVTGEIFQIEVQYLSENPKLPEGVIDKDYAGVSALSYAAEKGMGLKKPKIRSGEIGIFERKLVYDFVLDKGLHRYRVIVDAFSGKVREFEELSK